MGRGAWARAFVAVLVASAVACQGATPTFPNSTAPTYAHPVSEATGTAASATPPAMPDPSPPTSGAPSKTCVEGWMTPEEGTPDFTDPIGLIRGVAPFEGEAVVVDMRLFVGPESPPSDKNYLEGIRRWYVKLYAADEPAYQGRFLVEERRFGRGVPAVAPYDTTGFASPDWIGFQYEAGGDPVAYEGLPGSWDGTPYDFVEGGSGLTITGVPSEVAGCLEGT